MSNTNVIDAPVDAPAEGVTQALNLKAVERVAEAGPAWLRERRFHAWAVYESTPMPTTRLEEWRYTDLSRTLDLDALRLEPADAATSNAGEFPAPVRETMDEDTASTGRLIAVDGRVVHTEITSEAKGEGVILTSLREATKDHPELLERYLGTQAVTPEVGKFHALNSALWSDGVLLYVPQGVHVELPIRATRWVSHAGTAVFSRTLIIAEAGSRVTYVDEILSDDFDAQSFVSDAVEVITEDGANVQYVSLQRLGRRAFYHSAQRTLAARDVELDTLNVTLGASVSRVDLNARMVGPGASSELRGLYFGDSDQHFDHNTSQDHVAPNATSVLLYKGALDERSRAVFRGIIRVHPDAQRTDAYQTNRTLLLSENARADSLPNLEIKADDVRCSHGATVGELDKELLFYLMSRGMNRQQAERLVVQGFLGDVLTQLPLGGLVEKVTRAILNKLAHG
ncbi:MAG: Fe-S cluster assembly protein SufD [Gemmatimonadota bacterium]|nr:MAG: Fe-S cluster assembly protein SufD [Gemmatimonadota bacterium]